MAKKNDTQVYVLSIIAAIALAAVAIGGLNALGFATNAPGTATAQVASTVAISLPTSTVDLGVMAQLGTNQTSGGPTTGVSSGFVMQNDGNVKINVTINATSLWTTASNPTANYSFAANDSSEGQCYNAAESTTAWTNMPASGSPTKFVGVLNYTNSCDTAKIEIKVIVPEEEGLGTKTSTVTVVASQA